MTTVNEIILIGNQALTVTTGISSLQILNTNGLISANLGINIATGQHMNIGTSGISSPLNAFGLITGTNGLTISANSTSLCDLATSGLISANAGIIIKTGQSLTVGTSGTTSNMLVYGSITGGNGLNITNGNTIMQSVNTAGLFTASAGLLSSYSSTFTGVGNSSISSSGVYISPGVTSVSSSNNYYFTTLAQPTTTGTTTGSAYTFYIAGAPTGNITTAYAAYIATGKTYIGGALQIPTGATAGYLLSSDSSGNATWSAPASTTFLDGTTSAPSITFTNQTSTGFYRTSSQIGITILGTTSAMFKQTGVDFTTGSIINIGLTGSTSALNVYGSTAITGTGSTAQTSSSLYVSPSTTSITSSNNYYFTTLAQPITTGTTTGSAYTFYIAGAPTGNITTAYAAYIAAGKTYIGGALQIPTGATQGYLLSSDSAGNATWSAPAATTFLDGTASAPSITFTSQTSTGFYRSSSQIGVTILGTTSALFKQTGVDFTTGSIINIGLTGSTSALNVYGASTLQSVTTSGLLQANLGITITGKTTIGGILKIPTGASTGYLLASDSVGNATWAAPAATTFLDGTTSAPSIAFTNEPSSGFYRTSGQISLSILGTTTTTFKATGIDFSTGSTINIGLTGTTSALNVLGLISGTNGISISGASSLQSLTATNSTFTGQGNSVISAGTMYIAPATTSITSTNNYYFTALKQPVTTGTTTGSAYTFYIAGAPTGTITTPYAAYIATGKTYIGGTLQIPTGATAGYMLVSDSVGNATWGMPTSTTFLDGTTTTPGIAFTNQTSTGFYRTGSQIGVTIAGTTTSLFKQTGIDFTTGSIINIGLTGTTSPLNVYGMITGYNGLTILAGTNNVQAINAAGLISANAGLTVASGQTLSILGNSSHTGTGNSSPTLTCMYIAPSSTVVSNPQTAVNYYFTYLEQPATTGSTTASAYTFYIAGAPTGTITTPYAAYIAAGKTYIGGALQIPTGAAQGYILSSDSTGTTYWTAPNSTNATGPIIGSGGITVTGGAANFQAINGAGLITGAAGLTISTGASSVQAISAAGLISGSAGITISTGLSTLQAVSTAGLLTANAGLTVATGATTVQALNVVGISSTAAINSSGLITGAAGLTINTGISTLQATSATSLTVTTGASNLQVINAAGLISGAAGLTISTGNSALQAVSTAGLITASAGLTVATGATTVQALNVVGISTTAAINSSGLITGAAGITISTGIATFQATTATALTVSTGASNLQAINAAGLISAAAGLTVSTGNSALQAVSTAGLITASAGLTVATGATTLQALTVAGVSTITSITASGLITGQAGITVSTGAANLQAVNVAGLLTGNAGLTISAGASNLIAVNATGLISGSAGITISTGTSSLQAVTAAGLITAGVGLTVTTGATNLQALNVAGISSLQATTCIGLITGQAGITISTGAANLQAVNSAGLLTCTGGLTVSTGATNVQVLNAAGLISGAAGITISTGNAALQAISTAGLITANLGLTVVTGATNLQALNVAGISTLQATTCVGLITGQAGITISTGAATVQAITAAGVITGNAGLTIGTGATAVQAISAAGLISGALGLTISTGNSALQAISAAGLITANAGVTVATGVTTVQTLNAAAAVSCAAGLTVTAGATVIQGALQITTGAASQYVLASDATGNAAWTAVAALPSPTINYFFIQAVTSQSSSTSTPAAITGMTLTPTSGTYIVTFQGVSRSNTALRTANYQLAKNGTQIAATLATYLSTSANDDIMVTTNSIITCNGSDVITVMFYITGGSGSTIASNQKSLLAVRVGA